MSEQDKKNIEARVIRFFKKNDAENLTILLHTFEEHEWCFTVDWLHKEWLIKFPNPFFGTRLGKLYISKVSDLIEFESGKYEDFLYYFELDARGLEEYWILEIPFNKKQISVYKRYLEVSTSGILKMVSQNIITIDNNDKDKLEALQQDFKKSKINCRLFPNTRKKL